MNFRNRAAKLFGREKKENAIIGSPVDRAVFADLRKRAAKIEEAVSSPPTLPSGKKLNARVWGKLAEDLFSAHYGDDEPRLRNRENLDPAYHVNRQVEDKAIREPSFDERRAMTRGQRAESAMALIYQMESYAKSYGECLGEQGEAQNEVAEQQDQIESIDDMLESLRQERNELHGDPQAIDQQIRELAQDKRAAVDALQAAEQAQQAIAGNLVDAATKAAQSAADAATKAVRIASLTPGSAGGPGGRVSPDRMLALMERIDRSSELQRMMEMLGQFDISMGNTRLKLRKGGYEEVVDMELGRDLPNVLLTEKALLSHPLAQLLFYKGFLEGTLNQYETWSEEELKRGAVIIGADSSGSTRGIVNECIRAMSLATIGIGNREGRNCAALEYGSVGQLNEFWFPKGKALDTETMLDFAEHFYGGGTNSDQVMRRAKELMETEAPFHSADLLIITDGADRVTPQTIEDRDALRAMGVKIHGIAVGRAPTDYLITVCDEVSSLLDYAGPNSTSDRIAIDLT